jgi:osmoprotectant transport system permease protein
MGVLLDAFDWLGDSTNWGGTDGIVTRAVEHLWLTGLAMAIACLIALPLAFWLGHIGRGGTLAINIGNVGRAVPTYAVLALLVLTALGRSNWSTIIALVLFALPPLLTNGYVGIREVDRDAVEAARGMGMTGWQMVRRVELPLAVPLIMNGVRVAAVQVFATATVAAMVAGPGLGRIITQGFAVRDFPKIVAGAIVIAILALVIEGMLELVQRRVDPVSRARRSGARRASVSDVTEEVVGVE